MDINALKLAAASFKAALQQDDRQALVAAAHRLVQLRAPLGDQWRGLAQAVFKWGELTLALTALDTWMVQGAGNAATYEKATLLARVGKIDEAIRLAESLPPDSPTPVANAYLQGSLATNLGDRAKAEEHFRRAIRAAPDSGRAWLGLAQLGPVTTADEAAMRKLAQSIGHAGGEDRAALETALGLIEHGRAGHAAAFDHFDRATRIQRERYSYNPRDNELSAQIAGSWTAEIIGHLGEQAPAGTRKPIFVTGLPRSGTTLVEQILVSHSAVDGGGELGLALQLEAIIGGFSPGDVRSYLAAGGAVGDLRDTYLRLVSERFPGEGAFVDKTLNQSRGIGPLSMLFPEAPVVWLRRDPLDSALSIYRTWLANNTVGSWSLPEIAHHMQLEDKLFEHWSRELRGRVLAVAYEELVADPRAWIERITRHCGLQVEERQFDFHRLERGVTTASAMQVREPVNRKAVGGAQRYREQLQPFVNAYSGESRTGL